MDNDELTRRIDALEQRVQNHEKALKIQARILEKMGIAIGDHQVYFEILKGTKEPSRKPPTSGLN